MYILYFHNSFYILFFIFLVILINFITYEKIKNKLKLLIFKS